MKSEKIIITTQADHNSILTLKGNYYQIGYQIGKLFRKQRKIMAQKVIKIMERDKTVKPYLEQVKNMIKKDYDYIYQELCGRAEGAGVSLEAMLYDLSGEMRDSEVESCTSIMVKTGENIVLGHNEDGNYNKDNVRPVKLCYDNGNSFLDIITTSSCPSYTVLVRPEFIYTINYIWFNQYNWNFLPVHIFLRVLAESRDIPTLFEVLQTVPLASAVGINLCDRATGKMYYIEKVLDKYSIKEVDGVNIHANHLMHRPFLKFRPPFAKMGDDTTYQRQMVAELLLNNRKDLTAEEVYKILTFRKTNDLNSVLSTGTGEYSCKTYATYLFDFNKNSSKLHIHDKKQNVLNFKL